MSGTKGPFNPTTTGELLAVIAFNKQDTPVIIKQEDTLPVPKHFSWASFGTNNNQNGLVQSGEHGDNGQGYDSREDHQGK